MPTILATGFAPWGDHQANQSWDALQDCCPQLPSHWKLERRRLPVSWQEAIPALKAGLDEFQPAIVISFGQYNGERIRLETKARNHVGTSLRDGQDRVHPGELIEDGGPDSLNSTLPLDAIEVGLLKEGIPQYRSSDAGRFLCNFIFYGLMRKIAEPVDRAAIGGFIHVPQAEGMAAAFVAKSMQVAIETAVQSLVLSDGERTARSTAD